MPSLSPTPLAAVTLIYRTRLSLTGITCAAIAACGNPCILSITQAQAAIAGVPISAVVYLNCTDTLTRRRLFNWFISNEKKQKKQVVQAVNSVIIFTQTVLNVPAGAAAAQVIFTTTTTNLANGAQSGQFTTALQTTSLLNNAGATSTASVTSATSQQSSIATISSTPTSSPTTATPSTTPTDSPTQRYV